MFMDPTLVANLASADVPTSAHSYTPGFGLAQEILDFSEFISSAGLLANAGEWKEELHPRGEGGRFGSGGGGAGGGAGAGGGGGSSGQALGLKGTGPGKSEGLQGDFQKAIGGLRGGGKGGASAGSGSGGGGAAGKEIGKGGSGTDIQAAPVAGGGRVGKGSAREPIDVEIQGKPLDMVDKWLAGEGEKSNHPVAKAIQYVADKVGHAEHVAKAGAVALAQYTKDKVADSTSRLPAPARAVANAGFIGLRVLAGAGRAGGMLAVKAAFSYWTGISKVAENVAREKGATPDQAKKITSTLSAIDMGSLEVTKGGAIASMIPALTHALHFTHSLAAVAASIPVATTAYLAGNAVRHPIHTAVAAGKSIAALAKATGGIAAHPVKTAKAVGKFAASEFKKGYNIGGISEAPKRSEAQAAQAKAVAASKGPQQPRKVDTVHHSAGAFSGHTYRGSRPGYCPTFTVNTLFGSYLFYPPERIAGYARNLEYDHKVYVWNEEVEQQAQSAAQMVADAMEAHDYSDWYNALLAAALDHGYKLPDAIAAADAAMKSQPEDPTPDEGGDDDAAMTEVFGDWIHGVK